MNMTINIPQSTAIRSTKFRPDRVPGLALWFDAADSASVTLDGSNNVEQWNDKGPFGYHVTNATPANRPGVAADGGIAFTSASHQLTNATNLLWTAGNAMFVAFRCTDTASYATITGDDLFLFMGSWGLFSGPSVTWGHYSLFYTGGVTSAYSGPGQITTSDRVFQSVTTGTTSAVARVIGATTRTSTPKSAATPSVANNIRIGAFPRGNMVIYEVIALNRTPTESESTMLETYLFNRWGAK